MPPRRPPAVLWLVIIAVVYIVGIKTLPIVLDSSHAQNLSRWVLSFLAKGWYGYGVLAALALVWALVTNFIIYLVFKPFGKRITRYSRWEQLKCVECGYDLRTHPAGANCPECGKVIPSRPPLPQSPKKPSSRRTFALHIALLLSVIILLAALCIHFSVLEIDDCILIFGMPFIGWIIHAGIHRQGYSRWGNGRCIRCGHGLLPGSSKAAVECCPRCGAMICQSSATIGERDRS